MPAVVEWAELLRSVGVPIVGLVLLGIVVLHLYRRQEEQRARVEARRDQLEVELRALNESRLKREQEIHQELRAHTERLVQAINTLADVTERFETMVATLVGPGGGHGVRRDAG